ncbi:unnamed protein product, partial [Rotaria magnacalcarata]
MAAFLNRVFGKTLQSSSKKNVSSANASSSSSPTSSISTLPLVPLELPPWIPPDLNRDHIRLLVFSDSDDVGLELIFDSKTLRLISSSDNDNITNKPATAVNTRTSLSQVPGSNRTSKPPMGPSNSGSRSRLAVTRFAHRGKIYELMKASNDIRNYADYIFGTMPLLFKGTGMKIHTSKSPLQLMMSRVFAVQLPERADALVNTSIASEPDTISINPFNPYSSSPSNRSFSSNASVASSTISSIDPLGEDLTNQRFGRLYRRWLKCANRSMKKTQRQPGRRSRRCIGVAFIVTFQPNELSKYQHFEEFFCTHAPLIENHFHKIMATAEANINERNTIAATMLDKLFSFKDELYILYTRPRLVHPAWYILTQEHISMSKRRALAQQLCSIIDLFTTPKYGETSEKLQKKVPVALQSPTKPAVASTPAKTLMALSLFEPCHLGPERVQSNNDYRLDLALSLISSVTSSYSSDFILQAIETTNINDIRHAIVSQHTYDVSENGGVFLNGDEIDTSITILINIDDMSVNLYSSKHNEIAQRQERTTLIQPLIENAHLAQQLLPADFALLNMEDSLQEIYFLALAILKYMKANNKSLYSQESVHSFTSTLSTASIASSDTDEQR